MTDTQQATKIVEDLFDALRLRDTDRALALLDDRVVWHNVGLPKVRGTSNVGRFLALLAEPTFGFDVVLHNIAADGDIVLTERTDAPDLASNQNRILGVRHIRGARRQSGRVARLLRHYQFSQRCCARGISSADRPVTHVHGTS